MLKGTINSMRPRFLEWKYLSLEYINLNRVASGLIDNGPALGSTMAEYMRRQHAIILTNDGLFHWRIHESLGLNELNWATTDMDSVPSQPRHTSPMM